MNSNNNSYYLPTQPSANLGDLSQTPSYDTYSTYSSSLTKDYQSISGSASNIHSNILDGSYRPKRDIGYSYYEPSRLLSENKPIVAGYPGYSPMSYLDDDNRICQRDPYRDLTLDKDYSSLIDLKDFKYQPSSGSILSPLESNHKQVAPTSPQSAKSPGALSTNESSSERDSSFERDYDDEYLSLKAQPVSVGLPNLGNTCYMNSVLQCLFNSEKLCDYLSKNKYFIDKSESPLTNSFIQALSSAFNKTGNRKNLATPLFKFKKTLGTVAPIFQGYSQNDAHEFFSLLIEKIHDELNMAPKKSLPYKEFEPSKGPKGLYQMAEEWKRYSQDRDDSLVKSTFGGILLSEVTCTSCGHVSYTFQDTLDLPLDIKNLKQEDSDSSDTITNLHKCLKSFTTREPVEGYACDKCKKRDTSFKRTTIWQQPDVLVVQLKRFVYDLYGERDTVKDRVAFPLEDLILDEFTHEKSYESKNGSRYKLYAVVNHFGDLDFGHYTAFVHNEGERSWYQYDDSHVSKMSEEDILEFAKGSSEPYILFYKRV